MSAVANNTRVLVIGFGNPLRGDDAVGWVAARELSDRLQAEGVAAFAVHQLTPELAESASRAELLILIDAAADSPPGQVHATWVEPEDVSIASMHDLSPQALVGLAAQVYGRRPLVRLFTVGAADFVHRQGLSPQAQHGCDLLVSQVERAVRCWLETN